MGFLARLTTYAAGVVPRIKAADLNGIQDAIVELILGNITVKQIHVDGIGNAASSVNPGDIKASGAVRPQRSGFGTTLPTGTLAIDEHTKGYTRTATFTIAAPGDPPTFGGGDAVYAMEYLSTGLYRITWDLVLTQLANNIACHANYHGSGYVANVILTDSSGTGGRFRTQIGILNAAHNLEDAVGRISVIVEPR